MHELKIENIHITADNKNIVSSVSMNIKSGELHIVMGSNGSGKSTLAGGIMGYPNTKITEGSVSLDGEDITQLSTDQKARKGIFLSMQYLPEIEGVTLTTFLYRAYKIQKDENISILDFRKHLEDVARSTGVDTVFLNRELNVGFSGGEKKLSEMLQLAILEPKYAILDELDSGVDVDGLVKIIALLENMQKKGVGIILITHNPTILEKLTPHMIHIMKEGKLVQSGGVELIKKISDGGFNAVT